MITCLVRIYALLPDPPPGASPGKRFTLEVEDGTTLANLIEAVLGLPPDYAVAVNGKLEELDRVLRHEDRVDLFPPLSGG